MQTLVGRFVLKLIGIPLVIAYGKLNLVAESGSEAVGHGIIIGPGLMIALVGPKFRKRHGRH